MVESLKFGPKAFRRGPETKKWQIEAKLTWHLFGGEINWFGPERRDPDLENQESG
jgi:hypothetical protein